MAVSQVVEIAIAAIASAGGVGAIVAVAIHFSANQIADRLSKKYQQQLTKEIEHYKTELSKKEYVSKTRFDTEFALYRELNLAFSEMVRDINLMIPGGVSDRYADESVQEEYEEKRYSQAKGSAIKAQDTLFANASFIPRDLYDGYNELFELSVYQLGVFESRYNIYTPGKKPAHEDFKRSRKIREKWLDHNNKIRDYLNKLDVVE